MGLTAQRSARVKAPIVKDSVSYNFRIRCCRLRSDVIDGAAYVTERKPLVSLLPGAMSVRSFHLGSDLQIRLG
jgi:hypothetical protein